MLLNEGVNLGTARLTVTLTALSWVTSYGTGPRSCTTLTAGLWFAWAVKNCGGGGADDCRTPFLAPAKPLKPLTTNHAERPRLSGIISSS